MTPNRAVPSMLSLSGPQLRIVMDAARAVPIEKRSLFLQRVAAILQSRGQFNDADVARRLLAGIGWPDPQTNRRGAAATVSETARSQQGPPWLIVCRLPQRVLRASQRNNRCCPSRHPLTDSCIHHGPAFETRPRSRISSTPPAAPAAYEGLLHRLKLLIVLPLMKVLKLAAARIPRQLAQ